MAVHCLDSFIHHQLKLLELERDAEIQENSCLYETYSVKRLQEKGLCIPKLEILEIKHGLFGRLLLKFVGKNKCSFPSHAITSGDIVGMCCANSEAKLKVKFSGVILFVHDSFITVTLEKDTDLSELANNEIYSLLKLANDVTYKRLKRILKTYESKANEMCLNGVLFGTEIPCSLPSLDELTFYNQYLNETQKDAIRFALSQKKIAVIHGPPGTGKTTTLIECIMQCVLQKNKVLACAPSNIAVDNLIEKLAPYKIKMVRLGHPARASEEIQKFCLDSIISRYDGADVIEDMQNEMARLKDKISSSRGPKKVLWNENKHLRKDMKDKQKSLVKHIINNADVILSTLTSASEDGPLKYADKEHFDICFIDECSQALEIACWIPLVLVKRCILAGDHNQLPPTIVSTKAAKQGFSLTLMERLIQLHGESITKMLTIQYRMNHIIMEWPSKQLYDSRLIAYESVQNHLLKDLPHVKNNEDTTVPLLLIDTDGCDLYELETEDEESKGNEGEADLVHAHVESLLQSGVLASEIAVITPYNMQIQLIKSRFQNKYTNLEIKSIDGFQGREKEAVVLSLVRSNQFGEVGFLSEDRRINVAITRAKRSLTVICNSKTVSHSPFLKAFISYCEEKGEVRSAFQYAEKLGNYSTTLKKSSREAKNKDCSSKSKVKNLTEPKVVSMKSQCFQQQSKCDDIDKKSIEDKLRNVIQSFIKSSDTSYSFSKELSSFERKVVHEISEELSLIHISEGEIPDRFIKIFKNVKDSGKESMVENTELENTNIVETVPIIKSKDVSKKKKTINLCSNKTKNKLSENTYTDEDFDSLIAEVMKSDKTCSFIKCKKSVAILGQICQFCKLNFCFSHFMPEIHGCGPMAKAQARSQIRKDGVIYPGSGKPEKKVDAIKQSYLQKKLNEKVASLANQRKTKPSK